MIATPGQRNDIAFAHDLIEEIDADALLADKGYDANYLIQQMKADGTDIVIPPKRDRKLQRS